MARMQYYVLFTEIQNNIIVGNNKILCMNKASIPLASLQENSIR